MSISNESVQQLIKNALPDAQVLVNGDGYKYEVEVISNAFEDLKPVKRQQLVYASVKDAITSGQLHALTIRALTPTEKNS